MVPLTGLEPVLWKPERDFKCEKIAQHWGPVPAWNCPKFIWFFWKIII